MENIGNKEKVNLGRSFVEINILRISVFYHFREISIKQTKNILFWKFLNIKLKFYLRRYKTCL